MPGELPESTLTVLLVEDNPDDALLVREILAPHAGVSFVIEVACTLRQGLDRLAQRGLDIVLLDLSLPDSHGLETLAKVRKQSPEVPVVIMTGLAEESVGVEAVRRGAQDYLVKGQLNSSLIVRTLRYAIERHRIREELRRIAEEFRFAREVQEALLPRSPPALAQFDIAGISHPAAETGGDLFDYIPLRDGAIGIVIGDVSGHGLGPAILTAATHSYFRALSRTHDDVAAMLSITNNLLLHDTLEEQFVTVLLARLDPRTRSLDYSNAGHPAACVLDARGTVRARLNATGPPLGWYADCEFSNGPPLVLEPGEIVVFFTDGIQEAMSPNKALFGFERVRETVQSHRGESAREILDAVCRAAREFCQPASPRDDMTGIVVKAL